MSLSLAYSPCPNDTFIFHALVGGLVDCTAPSFSQPRLEDVETLNNWAFEGRMDVSKLSFNAYGQVADRYFLLRSGAALGRGCGPLLVAGPAAGKKDMGKWRIAVPGRLTTAAMLLKLFNGDGGEVIESRFDRIIGQVVAGEVDAGVIIHESRFTYQDSGLKLVQDLGQWWEDDTGLPIPLGGIAVRRDLGREIAAGVEKVVRQSLEYAFAHPGASREYIRGHAQELDEEVIRAHIDLYVNDFSLDLGEEGKKAIMEFLSRGKAAGFFPGLSPGRELFP